MQLVNILKKKRAIKKTEKETDAEITLFGNKCINKQQRVELDIKHYVKIKTTDCPSKSENDKPVITRRQLYVKRITLLCGQHVSLVQEITGCGKDSPESTVKLLQMRLRTFALRDQ